MTGETLAEQIAHSLRRSILRGHLAPGDPIKERDNAAEMGVSRTPMREAIRILAKEGLVELRPSRSPVVADPSVKEMTDSIEVMTLLELQSAKMACARATDEELAAIRDIARQIEQLHEKVNYLELFEVDMEFHLAIARAAHNEPLARTHAAFVARLWRVRYLLALTAPSRSRRLNDHRAIVAGLMARDPGKVADAIEQHLGHFLINLRERASSEGRSVETATVSAISG